jgi:hypothetical protein
MFGCQTKLRINGQFLKNHYKPLSPKAKIGTIYFQFVGPELYINCDSMGVVMEMHEIPSGESSGQVRVLEKSIEVTVH